ncbi:hypothetical protein PMAYCL1PPCAC_32315, partial [Pristionchus mayeri]
IYIIIFKIPSASMPNLSLHPLWHTAMPAYQHAVGVITHSFSALALYIMVTKTPKPGRAFARYLIGLQISITLTDLNFGFLASPIGLYPIPGGLCNGVLCTIFGFTGHPGITLMFFTVAYVGISVIYCFHYKYIIILQMAKHHTISLKYRCAFRVVISIIYAIPCFIHMGLYRNLYASLYYLVEDTNYRAFVYDLTMFPGYTILIASTTLFVFKIMILAVIIIFYFVASTFYLLSQQLTTISDNTRKLQRKLLMQLLTLVPLTIQLAPLGVYAYSMIAVALTPDINNVIFCFQMTHAFVHTTILLATTPSYREYLML